MGSTKPRKSGAASGGGSLTERAAEWIELCVKHFELNLLDGCVALPADASDFDFQSAAVRALLETLRDSGMEAEAFSEAVGQVLIQDRAGAGKWTSKLNQRRFELIDNEIQGSLTPAERVELAGLTRMMREQVDSEANLPMEGARALHRKLLELDAEDRAR